MDPEKLAESSTVPSSKDSRDAFLLGPLRNSKLMVPSECSVPYSKIMNQVFPISKTLS